MIKIQGYATDSNIKNKSNTKSRYSSNKELAQARAQSVKMNILNQNIKNIINIDTSYIVLENNNNSSDQKAMIQIYKKIIK